MDGLINTAISNPLATTGIVLGTAAAATGVAVGVTALVKKKKKKTKKGIKRDRRFKSKEKHEKRYKRKRKYKVYGKKGWIHPKKKKKVKTGRIKGRKVYYARKTGQPYILLRNGRARFIKGKRRKS